MRIESDDNMKLFAQDVTVRDFREEDIPNKVKWINNPENNQFLHYVLPMEEEKTRQWFQNKNNDNRQDCVIEYQGKPVGLIGLLAIDYVNQKAEFYISIGETCYKHKGISTRAVRLVLNYAFEILKLNKIYLNVDAENEAACRLYEKCGFQCEGYFKRDLLHHGKLVDRKRYAILRTANQ